MFRHGAGWEQGQELANLLQSFISPLEEWLDRQIDRRLVRTLFLALVAIVRLRHSRSGLLLSELGAHILSPAQAPAGTKRLSNLLRSPKWSHTLLEKFLWHRAEQCLTRLEQQGRTALAIWDESVLEKPESIADSSIRRGCARSAPARRHASSASSRATTILPVGRRCSCPACSGSPSWWPGCRGLPAWPPCAGGPAGAIWPVAGRNRPHRYSPSALKAGRSGWSTSSTRDMPGHPGSGSWEYIKPGSSSPVHHALAHPLSLGRREGRASRLADHPGQTLPRLSPDLGHSPPSISQDRHRGGLGMNREPSPSRRGTVAGGLSSRQGPYSLVPADQ